MATTGVPPKAGTQVVTIVAPGHTAPPPPATTNSDGGDNTGGGMLAQFLGTLGLIEIWMFIIYVFGKGGGFTDFESYIFRLLALFEVIGRGPGALSLCLLCNNSSSIDSSENVKTMTRDQLHNVIYPRSPPGSRQRRDFTAMAWYSLVINAIPPVGVLLSFYPVWTSSFDEELWIRAVPSVIAVLAIVAATAGALCIDSNQSSYVLTVLYASIKVVSIFLLVCGGNRLLLGDEGEGGDGGGVTLLGVPLACLQAIKIGSAVAGAGSYIRGRRDENLPQLKGLCRAFCFCELGHA